MTSKLPSDDYAGRLGEIIEGFCNLIAPDSYFTPLVGDLDNLRLDLVKAGRCSYIFRESGNRCTLRRNDNHYHDATGEVVLPLSTTEQSESPVLLDALRKLHSPYGIYDACEHDHKDGDPDAIQVDEIGLTCSAAKLYDICNACCGPGESDYQSLECAENHEHGPDIPICSTVALLASFQAKGHDPAEVRDRIAFAIWKSYWPDQTEDWIREHWQANATIKGDKVQRVPYILADVVIEEMGSALWLKR